MNFTTIYKRSKIAFSNMVFLLLLMLMITVSCGRADTPGGLKVKNKPVNLRDDQYEYIHKHIYENPALAREEAQRVLDTLDDNEMMIRIKMLKYLGSSYVFETNYQEAIKYYYKALSIAGEIELWDEIANLNNNLGVIYNETGNYKTAYLYLIEALTTYEKSANPDKKVAALNNIGLVYLNMKNYEKAHNYFNQALDTNIKSKDTILVVSVLNNIALNYLSEERPKLALDYLDKAVKLSERVNNNYGLCISYQLIGNANLTLHETDKALEAYSVSVDIARKANLTYQYAVSRIGIARVLQRLNRTTEALEIANNVMKVADEQSSLSLKSDVHLLLSDIYETTWNAAKSLSHYKAHITAQQEVINQTIIQQVYDVELNNLNQLNRMQKLEIEKKELAISKKNNLLVFVTITFILIITGLYLLYINHRHRQKVRLQETVIDLTAKKSTAALEAEIQERKRIGQELHDSLGHLLSLAGLYTGVLRNKKDLTEQKRSELLESLMKSIDEAFKEVHTISHNLAPSLLSERGLQGALKNISDRINQSTGLTMSFDTYGLNGSIDNIIENTLFRTIQEIVNNTIKHANATRLFVQLTQGNNEISLITEDNGSGFQIDNLNQSSGHGLIHMKSRIENLNGTIHIDSNPNRGTIISILIPLSKKEYDHTTDKSFNS